MTHLIAEDAEESTEPLGLQIESRSVLLGLIVYYDSSTFDYML
jgi:hypothetical protein